jgi:hypothetical protein
METKMLSAKVIRVSPEIAQQIGDCVAMNPTIQVIGLLLVNDICVGVDTSIGSRKPTLNVVESESDVVREAQRDYVRAAKKARGIDGHIPPSPESDGEPFNKESIYNMIKEHGPIASIQIGDMLNIGRKKTPIRRKISQFIQDLIKTRNIIRENDNRYVISAKAFRRSSIPVYHKGTTPIRILLTEESILGVLRQSTFPMKTVEICDALGIDRKKGSARSRATKLLRNDLFTASKIIINEKGGGHSTYEIAKVQGDNFVMRS